ncbi:hypothetical protein ALC53_04136, partial [Atta colombica]
IGQILRNPKDQRPSLSSAEMYKISCSCGQVYIGGTGQEFLKGDYERHLIFCEWMRNVMENDLFLQNILFSYEAQFTNTEHINKHNINMHY